ncbi:hypothetical protein DENSPDRAFT_197736 [Dentipellis sp. KUC8613]|nr:hypothetical protein DENSPDRAFT_197736 [Dentipellis sp. KUC8613]
MLFYHPPCLIGLCDGASLLTHTDVIAGTVAVCPAPFPPASYIQPHSRYDDMLSSGMRQSTSPGRPSCSRLTMPQRFERRGQL